MKLDIPLNDLHKFASLNHAEKNVMLLCNYKIEDSEMSWLEAFAAVLVFSALSCNIFKHFYEIDIINVPNT